MVIAVPHKSGGQLILRLQTRVNLADDVDVLRVPAAHVLAAFELPQRLLHALARLRLVFRHVVQGACQGARRCIPPGKMGGGGGAWADVAAKVLRK